VDHDLRPVLATDRNDLQKIPRSVGSEVENLPLFVLTGGQRVLDGMSYVEIIDAVPPS